LALCQGLPFPANGMEKTGKDKEIENF